MAELCFEVRDVVSMGPTPLSATIRSDIIAPDNFQWRNLDSQRTLEHGKVGSLSSVM